MISEPIAPLCTCEVAGRVRGKGFPVTDLSARLKSCNRLDAHQHD
jgi:hypothetical protein